MLNFKLRVNKPLRRQCSIDTRRPFQSKGRLPGRTSSPARRPVHHNKHKPTALSSFLPPHTTARAAARNPIIAPHRRTARGRPPRAAGGHVSAVGEDVWRARRRRLCRTVLRASTRRTVAFVAGGVVGACAARRPFCA